VAAGAHNISIGILEDITTNEMRIEISDDGRGMTPAFAAVAADPFTTTRTTRNVGLGLAMFKEAAEAAHGTLSIASAPGRGTTVTTLFQLTHIDRKPLGNMAETMTALVATHEDLDFRYTHHRNGRSIFLDTKALRSQLEGGSLQSVAALNALRTQLHREEESLVR